jgi:hypothetical protein
MSVTLAPHYTRREYTWTTWKAVYATKGSWLQYDDDGVMYTIWMYDGPDVHLCQIYKSEVPYSSVGSYSQAQNDADKADFETNYKSSGNQPLYQSDSDGAQIVRVKAAKKGWSFWALPIEVTTSMLGANAYCKDSAGNDIGGITCKIYDGANAEITVAGILNANLNLCTKTVVDFEPNFDYEIIGGSLRINSNPSQDIRLWIVGAPDIPAIYGGSKEFASGINLKFLGPDSEFEVDGRVTKFLSYNATTHSGKIRLILKHPAGSQVNMQFTLHMYRQ